MKTFIGVFSISNFPWKIQTMIYRKATVVPWEKNWNRYVFLIVNSIGNSVRSSRLSSKIKAKGIVCIPFKIYSSINSMRSIKIWWIPVVIIDSVFYGVLFNDSMYQVATLFSDQPYGSLLQGKVVDMLYFPLIDTTWPEWVPVLGGNSLRFFEPVFNIADTAISTGVGLLLVFNKKAFPQG